MIDALKKCLEDFGDQNCYWRDSDDMPTLSVALSCYLSINCILKDFFEQLTDLTVVDKLTYGQSQWNTSHSTHEGFGRAQLPLNLKIGRAHV